MISPNVLKALRVIALAQADSYTFDAWYKSICRWYSREFHTPLNKVEELSPEHVIRTHYEDLFWKLKTGDQTQRDAFEDMIDQILVEDSPEVQAEVQEAEADDDDWYQQELAALDEKLNKQGAKITREKTISHRDGILIDKPNLSKDANIKFVEAEDEPVPDDDEGI